MQNTSNLLIAMIDGILAQRKLNGDPDVIATDDRDTLEATISQGKRIEAFCKHRGLDHLVTQVQEEGAKP